MYIIAYIYPEVKCQPFSHSPSLYWKEKIVWSPGYFVSSVSTDEKTTQRYVKYQGQKDSGQLRMEL